MDKLIDYIDQNYNGHIKLLGGLALGAQIVLEMLAKRSDICDYAILESCPILPVKKDPDLEEQELTIKHGLLKRKWFSRIHQSNLHLPKELFTSYYEDCFLICS